MANIEKDKPLPPHTKRNYDECYAKIVLESLYPNRYTNLRLADKPDLIDDNLDVGVEVTSAVPKKHREAVKLWYMMPYVDENQQERGKERMQQLGVEYQGGVQGWPSESCLLSRIEETPLKEVLSAFEKKVKLLNGGEYCQFQRYDLFINSKVWLIDEQVDQLLDALESRNGRGVKYHYVYLATSIDIFEFNLSRKIYSKNSYEDYHPLQFGWATKARKMVEEGEAE